jgi:protein TonB
MASSRITLYPDPGNQLSPKLPPASSFQFGTGLYEATEKGVLASLMESLHDLLFPPKLAPLQLSSAPIVLRDPMALKRDPRATALAICVNGLILFAIIWFGTRQIGAVIVSKPAREVTLVAPPPELPKAPPKAVVMSGGGGHPAFKPVARGNPPKFEPKPPILMTAAPKIQTPLPVQPAVNVQMDLKMAKSAMPNIGIPSAPAVTVAAGTGSGTGLGAGIGNGLGSGSGGNFGGGVFKVGGGVSEPQLLFAPDPQFTEEARQSKLTGKVVVYLQVSREGRPMHVRILHGLGMGLDEKALEAVRQYKFKPAMKDGHPVTVEMNVDVNFQIL